MVLSVAVDVETGAALFGAALERTLSLVEDFRDVLCLIQD
jgi:hypothetical protein